MLYFCNHMFLLHHTAAECNFHSRVFFALYPAQIPDAPVYARIRIFPHGTGVVEHKICLLRIRNHIADCR